VIKIIIKDMLNKRIRIVNKTNQLAHLHFWISNQFHT